MSTILKAGLTGTEIGKLVGLSSRSFLSHFCRVEQLRRERVDNRFVYFSSDEEILARQKQKRQEVEARARLVELPLDTKAIDILVERIKYPGLSVEQLSVRLRKKGHHIKPEVIRNFFAYHGILKKSGYIMVKVLKEHIDELVGAVTAGNLFPKRPTIPFVAEASTCCGWPLNVQKTHTRIGGVATLDIGEFVPRETVLVCRKCARIYTLRGT